MNWNPILSYQRVKFSTDIFFLYLVGIPFRLGRYFPESPPEYDNDEIA